MSNLLKETIEILKSNGKSESDVIWVGNTEIKTDWKNFLEIADIKYDDGFGSQKIASDLLVVGADFWLERHEYDGSEWWEYKSMPIMPNKTTKLYRLVGQGWESLESINKNVSVE